MKEKYKFVRLFMIVFSLVCLSCLLHAQIVLPTTVPVYPAPTPTPIEYIPIDSGVITPTPTPFIYVTPTPVVRLPDLIVKDSVIFTNGFLTLKLENEGTEYMYTRDGKMKIYSNTHLLQTIILNNNDSQWFRLPGRYTYFITNIRMNADAGQRRKIAVSVDPDNEIEELDEYQNTCSRTISAPDKETGPDFIISAASLSGTSLTVTVKNRGPEMSVSLIDARLLISTPDAGEIIEPIVLPFLMLRNMGSAFYTISLPAVYAGSERIFLKLETIDMLDEIDNTNNFYTYNSLVSSHMAEYKSLLSVSKIAGNITWIDTYGDVKTYNEWSQDRKDQLFSVLEDLEMGRSVLPSDPPELYLGHYLEESDAWDIYLAHIAHSLWLDVNDIVSWKLSGYSDTELKFLLDVRKLLGHDSFFGYYFSEDVMGRVTPWNSRERYYFMKHFNIIRETQLDTLYALADWMRGHLVHYGQGDDLNSIYNYPGMPPVDRILYPVEGWSHFTAGCWGTTGIFCALLKSLNMPVKAETINLDGTHSRPEFLSLNMSMAHTDDVYSEDLVPVGGDIPSSVYFYTMDEMESMFFNPAIDCNEDGCNSKGEQASFNHQKDQIENSLLYEGYYYLYKYAEEGEAYVRNALQYARIGEQWVAYAQPFFTPSQVDAKINLIVQRLLEIGGGDIEKAKAYVTERVILFRDNK